MYAENMMNNKFDWKKNSGSTQDDTSKTREIRKKTDTDYPPSIAPIRPISLQKKKCAFESKETSVQMPIIPSYDKKTKVITREQFENLTSLNDAYGQVQTTKSIMSEKPSTSSEVRVIRQMDISNQNTTVLVVGNRGDKLDKLVRLLGENFKQLLVSHNRLNAEWLLSNTHIDYVICSQSLELEQYSGFDLINTWRREHSSLVKGIVYTSRSNQPVTFTEVKQSSDVLELIGNLKSTSSVDGGQN